MIRVQNYDAYRRDISLLVASRSEEMNASICSEEPAELIKAISKIRRFRMGDNSVGSQEQVMESLTEEIADTLICIDILKYMYGLSDEAVDDMIMKKNARNMQRLAKSARSSMPLKAMAAAHECCGGRCID